MRYLSVCSGIEAVSVAWQPLGWEPAMFAEIDPFCCWLLRSRYRASRPQHMPGPNDAPDRNEAKRRAAAIRNIVALPADGDVINAGDFTKIGAEDVGTIDLLAGGTPCQSFSVAGKRAGLDDPRGNLTIEFARLADRLRPTWLVWEIRSLMKRATGTMLHAAPALANHGVYFSCSVFTRVIVGPLA